MEFDCPDLGTRTPGQWVSFAGPLVEREHVKSKRREELKSGKPSGPPKAQGLAPYTSCRRRDEQGLTDPSQRVSKSARAAVIAQQVLSGVYMGWDLLTGPGYGVHAPQPLTCGRYT